MPDLSNIQHIVVLMLENRSFDNVFGFLRPASAAFDGLDGNTEANNEGVVPWTKKEGVNCLKMPSPDPGESFEDITQQIFNGGPTATMEGFTLNYKSHSGAPEDIMHCFARDDLPSLYTLADEFAVSDRWFAAAPCQTWPNRFFAHTGTANGYENNTIDGFPYPMNTIFNELEGIASWNIYFHDFAQATLLSRLWSHFDHFRTFEQFLGDAATGRLPGYSFIEPMYYPCVDVLPNDMHPPHGVRMGDALVAQVYNAVRASPNWGHTLLVVTFDEHGGCYDHVPPPMATPPEPPRPGQAFLFDRYGVRVPAIVISPYTKKGTVLRPADGSPPFDHTSIIRTVRNCFGIKAQLSAREALAPDLSAALNEAYDGNRGPGALPVNVPAQGALPAALMRPVNKTQDLLQIVAANLKAHSDAPSVEELIKRALTEKTTNPLRSPTAGDAGDFVRDAMQELLEKFKSAPTNIPGQAAPNELYRGH